MALNRTKGSSFMAFDLEMKKVGVSNEDAWNSDLVS
jgi:hypothetical protein